MLYFITTVHQIQENQFENSNNCPWNSKVHSSNSKKKKLHIPRSKTSFPKYKCEKIRNTGISKSKTTKINILIYRVRNIKTQSHLTALSASGLAQRPKIFFICPNSQEKDWYLKRKNFSRNFPKKVPEESFLRDDPFKFETNHKSDSSPITFLWIIKIHRAMKKKTQNKSNSEAED